jgi:hypothetical protein
MMAIDKREPTRRADAFPKTMWSEVVAAADDSTPRSRQALENLCSIYWRPLYSYIRRDGHDREQAEDLTQALMMPVIFRTEGVDRLSFFCTLDIAIDLLTFRE